MLSDMVRAWTRGWAVSRGTPAPVEEPWGLRVEVGLPGHVTRHVLSDADVPTIRKLADSVTVPHTWIKACIEPQTLEQSLSLHWKLAAPSYLMSTRWRPLTVRLPDGYTSRAQTHGTVTRISVLTADGTVASSGQIAVGGSTAVVDKVHTEPHLRRHGLGRFLVTSLANAACERGAPTGVLAATTAGRALYESLDWNVLTPMPSSVYHGSLPAPLQE